MSFWDANYNITKLKKNGKGEITYLELNGQSVPLNAAGMNTLVGYIYDMLYGDSGGYPSYASAAAIILFAIVFTITVINLLVSERTVYYQ